MISIGTGFIYIQKSRLQFNYTEKPAVMQESYYKRMLNDTMFTAMYDFDRNYNHFNAWNSMQQKFRCCGTLNPQEWYKIRKELPSSCCEEVNIIFHSLEVILILHSWTKIPDT